MHPVEPAPLLLLHGFPLDARMWRHTERRFRGESRVIAPNAKDLLIGLDTPSIVGMAEHAAGLLDRPAVVCGLSMGGYIAQEIARSYPERVATLVLCDTRSAADTEQARANRNAMIAAVREHGVAAAVAGMLANLLYHPTPETRAEVDAMVADQSPETIIALIQALRDRADTTRALQGVRVPVFVLAGEHDPNCPVELLRSMVDSLPRGRMARIPNAGHFPPLEAPRAFNETLARFLAEA